MPISYVKLQALSIQNHSEMNERWVQDRIAEDPSILGLGDLVLRDRERVQPRAGRLDLLLQDPDDDHRYEVEIQLGATDESHLVRTLEYWDIERRRYPQYDHTAVIVAEHITSRFLNVISLFNGFIPLIAIQMQAIQVGDSVSLSFVKVLDQVRLGDDESESETAEVTDRAYWENRASRSIMELIDALFEILRTVDPAATPGYNKFYVSLRREGRARNYVHFKPKKQFVWLGVRVARDPETEALIEKSGLEVRSYDERYGDYLLRVVPADLARVREVLAELFRRAFTQAGI